MIIRLFKLSLIVLSFMSCSMYTKKQKTRNKLVEQSIERKNKPNIIYILADDLGYGDLSCYGQKNFKTPNIDKLAAQGMLFTQHYSGSTICAPSRSALLTGMHTGHTPIRSNKENKGEEGQFPIPDSTYTMAEALKKAGYRTGIFGKWGLGSPGSVGDPINQGFDVFYGYNCQRLGHHYYPRHLWSNKEKVILSENKDFLKGVYAPKLIHENTLKFIEENKNHPFFAYVASIIPHAELVAPDDLMQKYRNKFLPEKEYKGVDNGPKYRNGSYGSQKEPHAAFAGMIDLLDQQVGEILDKLDELGISDNTLVIFTSDNGPHQEGGGDPAYFKSSGPLKGGKRDLYEGGIRVPMLVKWPGKIKQGSTTDHISAFWDVFPTLAEITEVEVPSNLDGISFLPEFVGDQKNQKKHEYLYWEFHPRGGKQAIRMGKWKGVKLNVLKNSNNSLELYDLSKDFGETNNVAAKFPKVVKQIEQLFKEARTPSNEYRFFNKKNKL